MRWAWLGLVLAWAITFFYAWMGRGYPWQFALVAGLAIGSLLYTAIRVAQQLWPMLRITRPSISRSSVKKLAPGDDEKDENKQ